ncbi:uncharacterized protein LOC141860157 isoform X2 [Acropora palmata]|uniref:uncharacterized protein LOC141860157 isoform X2 n=1 Tax=Acropora palmata TaxID=6131 RepID=UPI003DA1327C
MIYTNAHKRLLKKTIRLIIWHWNQDVRRSDLGRYNLGALKPYTQMCIAGGLGIPGSSQQRTPTRNCFAGVFMGFSITSAVFGGIIIIAYSITIAIANYYVYYHDYDDVYSETYTYRRYSYDAKMGLAAIILVLGIIEFGTGIWVSICLCLMKPCCTDSEQALAVPVSTPGYAVAQGVGGVPVAVPLQTSGITVQTQSSYDYALAGQTTGVPVPAQAVGNQAYPVVATLPPQQTEKPPKLGQYISLEEQS